jgi:3D (Asp-Asp-Asp) domain-containing protein
VVQWGVDGLVRREYAVVYENGEAVNWELVSETTVPPTHRIVGQGTMVVAPAPAPSPPRSDPQCVQTMRVWATWYTAASAGGSGRTATGTAVHKGTVAVDPRVIPLGTRMYIPGYGNGVAEDTGGAIIGNIIDLGYGPNDVKDWSSRYVDICILG